VTARQRDMAAFPSSTPQAPAERGLFCLARRRTADFLAIADAPLRPTADPPIGAA